MNLQEIGPLADRLWSSPVFGDSFEISPEKKLQVMQHMGGMATGFVREAGACFAEGMPDANEARIAKLVSDMALTSVGFGSGLSAGEINDVPRLTELAVLIGVTGWGNRLCDEGDQAMLAAIPVLCGQDGAPMPKGVEELVDARLGGLRHIERIIHILAQPEDEEYLLRASRDELMSSELVAHRLTMSYLQAADPNKFLEENAEEIANTLTTTGALPSATTPLYGIYRHHFPLPGLKEVYADPRMHLLLRVANSFIRVFDDWGDRVVDALPVSQGGAPSLNLFNQPHPAILEKFFIEQARITDYATVEALKKAFALPKDKQELEPISEILVSHIRRYVADLPPDFALPFAKYIKLIKRALEAGYINQVSPEERAPA